MTAQRTRRRRRGFALLAALALLTLTSLLALETSVAARAARRTAANAVEQAAGRGVAIGGLEDARTQLLRALIAAGQSGQFVPDPWAPLATLGIGPVRLGELRYDVVMHDVGETLHLNMATEDQLRRFLVALRVDAGRADRVAQAILDWRDGDDLHRSRGAERADYLRAGSAVLPANAPFPDVATLRHVAGVGDALYAQMRPHLTVVGSGRVNLNRAEPPVLITLPGMTDESVALIMRHRRRGGLRNLNSFAQELSFGARRRLLEALPALVDASVLDTQELHVTSVASTLDGVERARAEALMIKDNGVRVAWRRISP